jgi:hypothetical protein
MEILVNKIKIANAQYLGGIYRLKRKYSALQNKREVTTITNL